MMFFHLTDLLVYQSIILCYTIRTGGVLHETYS